MVFPNCQALKICNVEIIMLFTRVAGFFHKKNVNLCFVALHLQTLTYDINPIELRTIWSRNIMHYVSL